MDLVDLFKMKKEHIRINSKVAESVMGWHKNEDGFWYDENDQPRSYCQLWNPVENFDYAFQVEEKVKEMGLERDYVMELLKEFNVNYLMVKPTDFYNIAHASAYDRCEAALKAVEGKR
jgi:hypothetical protein